MLYSIGFNIFILPCDLYNGGFVTGGIIREWSKKPIEHKINKVEEYKKIQSEIDELKKKQHSLFTK